MTKRYIISFGTSQKNKIRYQGCTFLSGRIIYKFMTDAYCKPVAWLVSGDRVYIESNRQTYQWNGKKLIKEPKNRKW